MILNVKSEITYGAMLMLHKMNGNIAIQLGVILQVVKNASILVLPIDLSAIQLSFKMDVLEVLLGARFLELKRLD